MASMRAVSCKRCRGLITLMAVIVSLIFALPAFGESVTYTYDALNRLTSATYGASRVEYFYDSAGNIIQIATPYTITVTKAGDGAGTVTSDVDGIACGTDCAGVYSQDREVTLVAIPEEGSSFDGWSGDCIGTEPCTITVDGTKSVTATFTTCAGGLFYRDADGDDYGDPAVFLTSCTQPEGYVPDAGDCDDGDADRFPGNPEVCDGKDNNCDGQVDEGLSFDLDGDGHTTPESCTGTKDDCDDGDADRFPGNPEVCDGIDQDCDGLIDEDVGTVFYLDQDNDGYGNPCQSVLACSVPAGYVSEAGDCNDGNPLCYPGAPEIPCDFVDQDCDGQDLQSPGGCYQVADFNMIHVMDLSANGTNGAWICDGDNDGTNDLVVLEGSAVKIFDSNFIPIAAHVFDEVPQSLAWGDLDSDGMTELVVGTSEGDSGGYVYVGNFVEGIWSQEGKSPLIESIRFSDEIKVGDLDNDDDLEVAVGVSYYGQRLIVYEYEEGIFTESWRDNIGSDVNYLDVGDIDGDGSLELAVGTECWSDYRGRIYRDGSLVFSTGSAGRSHVSLGDIDGDGSDELTVSMGTRCGGIPSPDQFFTVYDCNATACKDIFTSTSTPGYEATVITRMADVDLDGNDEIIAAKRDREGIIHVEDFTVYKYIDGDIIKIFEGEDYPDESLKTIQVGDFDRRRMLVFSTHTHLRFFAYQCVNQYYYDFDADADVDGKDLAQFLFGDLTDLNQFANEFGYAASQ